MLDLKIQEYLQGKNPNEIYAFHFSYDFNEKKSKRENSNFQSTDQVKDAIIRLIKQGRGDIFSNEESSYIILINFDIDTLYPLIEMILQDNSFFTLSQCNKRIGRIPHPFYIKSLLNEKHFNDFEMHKTTI